MASNFKLRSPAFTSGSPIPATYTCEGDGVSPPLSWTTPPDDTHSLALVVDDPDAPGRTFTHWVLFNLSPDRRELVEGVDLDTHSADDQPSPILGVNDFGDIGYGPPCPPSEDEAHGYSFRLYALDTSLDLGEGVTREQLTDAMDGHIVAEADLVGTYRRSA
jgi:hypothetical protein